MKNKNFLRNWIILIVVVCVLGFFGYRYYLTSQLEAVDPKNTKVQAVVIPKGESSKQIVQKLYDAGLIRSTTAFSNLIKSTESENAIQAGDYKLSPSMSAEQILKELKTGAVDKWVTLLEGWRVEEMAERLNKDLGIDKAAFIKASKEGYMFPDTYLFNKEATAETIASTLKNTFNSRYTEELQAKIKAQGLTPAQGVIVASMVEREARSDEVRTQVASIILKRMKIGMALNIDATIQYALGYQQGEKSWWKRNLTYDDLKFPSPYNSYTNAGLPPTPICNPSLSSLKAVANANSNTPYLYYFHDSQGNTYYGKTLDEHNANVAKYR